MKDPLNIVITGVGGQGNILVSEILAKAAAAEGFKVTVGESYGLSQRGGAVSSHIRLSQEFQYGAVIPAGHADIIVGFEPVEAARSAAALGHPGTKIILNPRPVYPVGVLTGGHAYPDPDELIKTLKDMSAQVLLIESSELAALAGDPVVQNIVMVGALAGSGYLPLSPATFTSVINTVVPERALEMNERAFQLGFDAACAIKVSQEK
ncbi:indolepyruvate oxidoreductase subunit beta [Pelotomaculum schinkii]|uniref:Indolepyruvate oxidoreductase subunit beta n=1 Tax=Pelotomaculum schinkii TaxID=78350 RepID=A0A4Y7RBG6_9FIRM|nr:indolepyruvate oxidoreductase subunit beta [Pelotomaculum schinkii]TEB06051.1 indolepyruvate oxidoreductase subunit beta [Pelotomaculum schinkii]